MEQLKRKEVSNAKSSRARVVILIALSLIFIGHIWSIRTKYFIYGCFIIGEPYATTYNFILMGLTGICIVGVYLKKSWGRNITIISFAFTILLKIISTTLALIYFQKTKIAYVTLMYDSGLVIYDSYFVLYFLVLFMVSLTINGLLLFYTYRNKISIVAP